MEQLASFQYKIVHRPGKLHCNADALSRLPTGNEEVLAGGRVQHQGAVDLRVCSLQESGLRVAQASALDELHQAQLDDPVLRRIMDCKRSEVVCPEDPELQRFARVWNQL